MSDKIPAGSNAGIEGILGKVREHLIKMSNPNYPQFELTITRNGYMVDQNQVPIGVEFEIRAQHIALAARVQALGVSGIIGANGAAVAPNAPGAMEAEAPRNLVIPVVDRALQAAENAVGDTSADGTQP